MSARVRSQVGAGVVEMLVALALLSVVLGAMISVLIQQQRFYLVANDAAATTGVVEKLETVMTGELMPLSASGNDIVYAGPDSMVVRVFRGVYSICAIDKVKWVVRSLTDVRAIFVDSVLVFSEGTKGGFSDDHWKPTKLTRFQDEGKVCTDGTNGYTMHVEAGFEPQVAEIAIGSPARVFELASFWLALENGGWFLKSTAQGGQPMVVSGPLAPADSAPQAVMQFRYLDGDGNLINDEADIVKTARIEIDLAAVGAVPMRRGGEPLSRNRNIAINMRNGPR